MNVNDSQLINIDIVDDHKMIVESLRRVINESDIARVRNAYYDLKSCREGLAKEIPDLLLLDIELPDGDGVDFCAEITKIYPTLKIIILTAYKGFNIVKHALHNGALGYILKHAQLKEILTGIKSVSEGKQFLCEEIDLLLKDKKNEDAIWLTNRELEVLKQVAEGYSTKEIATLIHLNEETVKHYRHNLHVKIGAKNVAELITKSYEMRLLPVRTGRR